MPSHWQVLPLKRLCARSALYGANESAEKYVEDGVRFLRTTDITDDGHLVAEGSVHVARDAADDYLLNEGDLLLSRSGTLGRSLCFDEAAHGVCAYAGYLVRFVPGVDLVPRYAFWFTKSRPFADWLGVSVIQSTIGNVNGQKYANLLMPSPPTDEQRAIVDFLDRETEKIDALVAKKQRLIELLQEKRTALISHAVTKGLDHDVPMKDSGIVWLGAVPSHWEIRRLRHVAGGVTVGVVVNPSTYRTDSGVPFLRGVDIAEGTILTDRMQFMSEESNKVLAKSILREGDVVAVRVGEPGISAVVPKWLDGANCASLLIIRRSERVASEYLCSLLNSCVGKLQFKALRDGAAQEQINVSDAVNILVTLPSRPEQDVISSWIARESKAIDGLVHAVRLALERLREYRSALITAAVTGQIDTRTYRTEAS